MTPAQTPPSDLWPFTRLTPPSSDGGRARKTSSSREQKQDGTSMTGRPPPPLLDSSSSRQCRLTAGWWLRGGGLPGVSFPQTTPDVDVCFTDVRFCVSNAGRQRAEVEVLQHCIDVQPKSSQRERMRLCIPVFRPPNG